MAAEVPKNADPDGQTRVLEREEARTEKPRMFRVILHNDDYTTMEFVVEVLVEIFRKSPEQAVHLMLLVHHVGHAVVAVYTREIAEAKCTETEQRARERGYPLRVSIEPEST